MDLPKQGVIPRQEGLKSEGRPLGRPAAVYASEAGRYVWRGQQQSLVHPSTSQLSGSDGTPQGLHPGCTSWLHRQGPCKQVSPGPSAAAKACRQDALYCIDQVPPQQQLSRQGTIFTVTPELPLCHHGGPQTAELHRAWRRFDRTHRLRHRMIGEAPHLLDPEVLDSNATADGKQRGLYYCPSSQGRSPESAAEFVDSIFEVPLFCPEPPVLRLYPPHWGRFVCSCPEETALPAPQSCVAEAACSAFSRWRGWQGGSVVLQPAIGA